MAASIAAPRHSALELDRVCTGPALRSGPALRCIKVAGTPPVSASRLEAVQGMHARCAATWPPGSESRT